MKTLKMNIISVSGCAAEEETVVWSRYVMVSTLSLEESFWLPCGKNSRTVSRVGRVWSRLPGLTMVVD